MSARSILTGEFFSLGSMLSRVSAMHLKRQRSLENHSASEHSTFIYDEM
jgi:hypothetical protein